MTDPGSGGQASEPYAPPVNCPACGEGLQVTRLQCPNCRTEVSGTFAQPSLSAADARQSGRLVNLPEPFASLLELFIRVRGNVKDVERELGLSYPTVRARLDEAFKAARPLLEPGTPTGALTPEERETILGALERGEITVTEATTRLRHPKKEHAT